MLCRRCYKLARGRGRGILDSLAVARTCVTQRTHRLYPADRVQLRLHPVVREAERIVGES